MSKDTQSLEEKSAENKRKYKPGKIRDRNFQVILDAAEEEFALFGFKGTSTQKIADRAGLAKANIHYYFNSKENLYLTVLDNIIHLWNDYFDEVKADDDPAEVLDNFIRKKVELAYKYPKSSRMFAMEIIQGAPHLQDYIRTEMRAWVRTKASALEQWMDQGKMKRVDPVYLIFLIWSSTQHYADFETQVLTIMNRAEYEREMIDQIADFLSNMILTGCGLTPPKRIKPVH
tara:strand:- start:1478 stop:2170 length:693 start_codon:yes stop_codon:yes gene_type:complete